MVKRVIVFRFDRDPLVCRSRVALLRALNPELPLHGLFGGGHGCKQVAMRLVSRHFLRLDSLYSSPYDGQWNWRNGDLALADWFRKVGSRLDFDVAHLIEWDLLALDPLERVYADIPPDAVGLTALTAVSELIGRWEWLRRPAYMREWEALLDYARAAWGYDGEPLACLMGGPCLPRAFLHAYAALEPPELCHDELRLPLAAQALGFPLMDTGLRRGWYNTAEDRIFSVGGQQLDLATVRAELANPRGRRVFHPVRVPWSLEKRVNDH